MLVVLLLSSTTHSVAQTIRLTDDPEGIYLPSDIQIQSLAPMDNGRYVAIWGTTWREEGGDLRTRLVRQVVDSTGRYGEPAVLTPSGAEPYGNVSAVSLPEGVLVFWWDRRASAPGTYARFIQGDGQEVSDEFFMDQRPFRVIELLDTLPDGDLRLLFSPGLGTRVLRFSPRGVYRDQDIGLEKSVTKAFTDGTGTFSRILLLEDSTALPLGSGWYPGPYDRIPAGRVTGHWYPEEGGALWIQNGAHLERYGDWTAPRPDTTILLPGNIASGVIFAGFEKTDPQFIRVSSNIDPPLEPDDYDYHVGRHRVYARTYVMNDGGAVPRGDTVLVSTRSVYRYRSGTIVRFELPEMKGVDLYAGESLPSRVNIQVSMRTGSSHYPGSQTYYSHLLEIDMEAGEVIAVDSLPSDSLYAPSRGPSVRRESHPQKSRVIARFDGVDIPLEADVGSFDRVIPVHYNQIFVQGDNPVVVLCHEDSLVRNGAMSRGEVLSIDATSMEVLGRDTMRTLSIDDPMYVPGFPNRELLGSEVQRDYGIGRVGNRVFAFARRWRGDFWDNLDFQTDANADYTISSTYSFYDRGGARTPGPFDIGPEEFTWYAPELYRAPRLAWDPNTNTLHAFVDSVRGQRRRDGPYAVGVIGTGGEFDSVRDAGSFYPSTFVPVSAGEYLYLDGAELRAWPGGGVLADVPHSLAGGGLQRLHGEYFLGYGQDLNGYRLCVYDLQGDSIASLVLSTPITRLVVDPGSPRIVLLTQMNNRLHVRLLNQRLEESVENVTPIAPPAGITMARPEATVIGDSLFVVWTGTDSVEGRQEVYLTRVNVPKVPVVKYPITTVKEEDSSRDRREVDDLILDLSGLTTDARESGRM